MLKNLLPFFFLPIIPFSALCQCCAHGNTVGGEGNPGAPGKDEIRILSFVKHSESHRYFENSRHSSFTYLTESEYNFSGVKVAYGISDYIAAELEEGYYINKIQHYKYHFILRGYGAADMTLTGKITFIRPHNKGIELNTGIGLRIPTANYRQRTKDGVLLSRDVQSGTGGYSFIPSLFAFKGIPEMKLRIFLTGRAEINFSNPDGYLYGNLYQLSLFFSYSINHRLTFISQGRGEFRGKDHFYRPIFSSGSRRILLTPQLNYSIRQKWDIGLMTDIPIYQYYNGTQFAQAFAISISLSRTFSFEKGNTPAGIPTSN